MNLFEEGGNNGDQGIHPNRAHSPHEDENKMDTT